MVFHYAGSAIFYENSGKGPAVVLLHGYPESHAIWENFRKELSKSFKVITPDLPGLGQSELLAGIQSMEMMATAIKALLDHEGIKKCVMAGHSMGGYVSLAFAELFPEMLDGLCLFHSMALGDTSEAKTNRDRTIALIRRNKNNFLNQFIPNLFAEQNRESFDLIIRQMKETASACSSEALIACISGMKLRPNRESVLSSLKVPVLFIFGKHDSRMPLDLMLPQTALPRISFTIILGNAGHMGFYEEKDLCIRSIKDFSLQCYSLSEANHSA